MQADLSLFWAHMSEGTFSQVTAHLFISGESVFIRLSGNRFMC